MTGNEKFERKLKQEEYIKHQGNSLLLYSYVCAGMAETAKNEVGDHEGIQLKKE
jgi:hypothetical protein